MLKNFLKKFFSNEEENEFEARLNKIIKEAVNTAASENIWVSEVDFSKIKEAIEILDVEDNEYLENFILYCSFMYRSGEYNSSTLETSINLVRFYLKKVQRNWSMAFLMEIFSEPNSFHFLNFSDLVAIVAKKITADGINEEIEKFIKLLKARIYKGGNSKNERVFINQLDLLTKNKKGYFISKDSFLYVHLVTLSEISEAWVELLEACEIEGMKDNTTKKWINAQSIFIKEQIGIEIFSTQIQDLIEKANQHILKIHQNTNYEWDSPEAKSLKLNFIFKAILWNCGIDKDKVLQNALFAHAEIAFKKKVNVGALSQNTGSAALFAFSQLPIQEGVPRLMSLKNKISNKIILKSIEKYIKEAAKNGGLSADNIEEISIPNYGMEEVGVLKTTFGTLLASTTFKHNGKNETIWDNNGKSQASVPAVVKTDFSKELKLLKNTIKEVEQLLPSQRNRIENQYLMPVSWTYKDWFPLYISHPVIGILGQRLIWSFSKKDTKSVGVFNGSHFENALGEKLELDDSTIVELWHPIKSTTNEIQQWRNYLINKQITQPFKQAFREIYIVTDAELKTVNYSNRFAAHILRQHQFTSLAKLRDWRYTLQGTWDSHNIPCKTLKHWNITSQYYVDAIDSETTPSGIFNFVATDQVRFYRGAVQLNMQEVPAMVFTEIMRDVDMYVGVCSIGNDPNWQNNANGQHQNYWSSYSFGELTENAKMRAETLKIIIPKLKISSKCSFEKNFLLVKGKARTYKIHLGSGNILMTPNDQYLCIVAARDKREDNLFIPFEGDSMLSIILSKAFLLADDDKITDETIVRQIQSR